MAFEHKYRVRIEDTNRGKMLGTRALLGIFEDIACFHASTLGQGPLDIVKKGYAWILVNWKIEILKDCYYGEILNVKTWPRKIDRVTTYRDYEAINEKGEIIAIGTSRWIVMDLKSRKPVRLTQELINPYIPLDSRSVFKEEIQKLKIPETVDYKKEYNIALRDIDANMHLHNISYLHIAYETLPADIFKDDNFKKIEIEYKKEITHEDKVECFYTAEEDTHIVIVKGNDIVCAILRLKE